MLLGPFLSECRNSLFKNKSIYYFQKGHVRHPSPNHLLPFFIQSSFKYTIEFVGPNVNLKISCMKIGREWICIISLSIIVLAGRWRAGTPLPKTVDGSHNWPSSATNGVWRELPAVFYCRNLFSLRAKPQKLFSAKLFLLQIYFVELIF